MKIKLKSTFLYIIFYSATTSHHAAPGVPEAAKSPGTPNDTPETPRFMVRQRRVQRKLRKANLSSLVWGATRMASEVLLHTLSCVG